VAIVSPQLAGGADAARRLGNPAIDFVAGVERNWSNISLQPAAGWAPAFLESRLRETATRSRIALATPLEPGYRALVPPPGFI
jgi:hypothetical protein